MARPIIHVSMSRRLKDRAMTALFSLGFLIALIPLALILWTTLSAGMNRLDLEFFTHSMRGVIGEGGGALHALLGTLLITAAAVVISFPIGVLTAIFLTEFKPGKLTRVVTFLIDVMSGIPSIVAGLFAYAAFSLLLGPGTKLGISGALALAILMIPTVVRGTEEMLQIVPKDLREAAMALGAPKWSTVLRVVLPHALSGIITSTLLGISRIIGESAPLLLAAGFTANMNYNLFAERMQSLPVFVYTQYANQGNPAEAFMDRAWTAALLLVLIVISLTMLGKLFTLKYSHKGRR